VTGSITLLGDVLGHAREEGWLRRPDARRQAATVEITDEEQL
jgi:dihydrofolate synthase/folylpolyglutamate synthase